MTYRKIVLVSLMAIVFLASFYVWSLVTFRLVSTNPPLSKVPDVTPYIDIDFNKKVVNQPAIAISPNILKSAEITGKTIRIRLKAMTSGKTYVITLNNVHSANNKSLNKALRFEAKKLPFEKLPKDQQQAIVNSQDPNDPSLLTNDPLVTHLPYGDLGYNISYVITTANNKPSIIIYIGVTLAGADYRQSPQELQNIINQREQAALAYIRSLGLAPAKYNIQYNVPPH